MTGSPDPTWSHYYRATSGRAPRDLLLRALELSPGEDGRLAIDLGCGHGTETLLLLASGWRVLAVDQEQEALDLLLSRVPAADRERLSVQVARFDSLDLPAADLVYAGLSLFFCAPAGFPQLWSTVSSSLRPGGRLAVHLLGDRDSWAADPEMTSHDEAAARELLAGFVIEQFVEVENDRPAVSGPKHWHLFEVIARKP